MSGSGYKSFSAGSVLTASDVNGYFMSQSIMYFAGASARDTAITSPQKGMTVYLADSGSVLVYYGATTGWQQPWSKPWGVLATKTLTSSWSTSATHTTYQDTDLSVSASWVKDRIIRVVWNGNPYASGGQQGIGFAIYRSTSTNIREGALPSEALSTSVSYAMSISGIFTPSTTATETVKVKLKAWTDNTAITDFGDATTIRSLVIEDIGPSTSTAPSA